VAELPDAAATAVLPNHNADLVAVGFTNIDPPANGAAEGGAYYYVGEGAADTAPGRSLIQNNFLVPTDFLPVIHPFSIAKSTSADGDAALVGYMDHLYANQATSGFLPGTSYLILRVNPDLTSDVGTRRYSLASAEATGVQLPTLTIDVESTLSPGDIDEDGDVDRSDAARFAIFYGRETGSIWTTGDFDGDGTTSVHDLALLQSSLGTSGSPLAVPEPSGCMLALVAFLAAALYNVRGRLC
jgi:hypothetical protein